MRLRNVIFCMIDAAWPWSSDLHVSRQVSYVGRSIADETFCDLSVTYLGVDGNCNKVAWFYKLG